MRTSRKEIECDLIRQWIVDNAQETAFIASIVYTNEADYKKSRARLEFLETERAWLKEELKKREE